VCRCGTLRLCSGAESGVLVGVLFDYFRAPDASTAAAVLAWPGGPIGLDELDVVDGKGIDPTVMMRTLQSLLTGTPYDELPWGEMLAITPNPDGPAVEGLTVDLRDALADAEVDRLPAVAEQWVRTEEFWWTGAAADVLPFLYEVTALARRARQAGELLYCWCSL
jgi:hypothetical protein